MAGRRMIAVEQRCQRLRNILPPDFATRLTGSVVQRARRRGKYILIDTRCSLTLLCHLGMTGSFSVAKGSRQAAVSEPPVRHEHIVFWMSGDQRIGYHDPRRFGMMDIAATSRVEFDRRLRDLGPEPLAPEFNARYLHDRLRSRKSPVKSALMDQRLVAGLGNIYVSEALWRAGISPRRRCNRIALARVSGLVDAIRGTLDEAIAAGGSTLRDHQGVDGSLGTFQHRFNVYGKDRMECPRHGCGGKVVRVVQAGRSTFYCRACQK